MDVDTDRTRPVVAPIPVIEGLLRDCCARADLDGAGVTVVSSDGSREPVFASDDAATTVERLQLTLGEGPCLDCATSGTPVLVPDLDDEGDRAVDRWPFFRDGARAAGVRAVFAFPIRIGAIWLGEVDFHRRRPGPLTSAELGTVLSAVDEVGLAVLEGPERHGGDAGTTGNVVLHQAVGMVMGQIDGSLEEALSRLRATAFAEGRDVTELAVDIVERRRRLVGEGR